MKRVTVVELAAMVPVGDVVITLDYAGCIDKYWASVRLSGVLAAPFEVADTSGAQMRYADAGAAIDAMVKALQIQSGAYSVAIASGVHLLRAVPSDLISDAKSRRAALVKAQVRSAANKVALDEQITALNAWGLRNDALTELAADFAIREACLISEAVSIADQIAVLDLVIPVTPPTP